MSRKFTGFIFGGMVLGAAVGAVLHQALPTPAAAQEVASYFSLVTDVFLRLIKMIIAPLVFSMLVVGIAHMGDTESIGRIGLKAMAWFIVLALMAWFWRLDIQWHAQQGSWTAVVWAMLSFIAWHWMAW